MRNFIRQCMVAYTHENLYSPTNMHDCMVDDNKQYTNQIETTTIIIIYINKINIINITQSVENKKGSIAIIQPPIFTALHEMQTRSSDENSVRPSVCPSVCQTRDPWQNGRKIGPDFYTIRKNIQPSFLRRRMVGGGRPLLRETLGQPTPVGTKSPIFNQ